MKTKQITILTLIAALSILLNACGIDIARNDDGSLNIEATMTEADIQREIKAAIADPLIQDMSIELQDGHILVSAQRKRLKSDVTDSMSFRLDLGAAEGHLTAAISEAQINNQPIDADRVALWNERTANRLGRNRNPNSTLQSVTVGDDTLLLIWRVETARSRSS